MRFKFGDYVLDAGRRELQCGVQTISIEPQVFDLLLYLVRQRHRIVSKDDLVTSVWCGRIVSDSTIASRINAARRAVGDDGVNQRYIRTAARRGIRFVGEVQQEETRAASEHASPRFPRGASGPPKELGLREEITFCKSADGVHLAAASVGQGSPIVKTASWLTHVEHDWQMEVSSPLFAQLAPRHKLVRYDQRGNGLSDWRVADFSFAALVQDLETVVDALSLERFALFGISQGAAVAIAYAARHPDRVSRLVLHGGYSRGFRKRGAADQIARCEALATLIREGWGKDTPAFRQVFTSLVHPNATQEQMRDFNEVQRISTSPENAAALFLAFGDIDVSEALQHIAAPALVMHSRDDALVPFDQGLALAHAIPDARFVPLESRNHILLPDEPAWPGFVAEICDFLE
ncbi:lysine decarboxylase transcriptional regulator, CadC [Bradyrhizobium brasilense]|uniref:Lysine decarboxylase transcriptional regulator, CadC n=1 Tax=Bradyrhizobium brasilense TaxID=1419277 RepID=A0A1G6I4Y7_9BRAD|nr:alpha/beta fold hydrolase [Bradyrhizobium brasilense]SDC01521.1 lysine decarboxylase transcriptional regulator, CadC [Bradyrhizobium brasilense]